jgi:hypothetical protein
MVPSPENNLTAKRLSWVTWLAGTSHTAAQIADLVGQDATAASRFDSTKSAFGPNHVYNTAWEIMDGNQADCITLSWLMKYELDILGALGSAVGYVRPRHDSWDGLLNNSPEYGFEMRVPGNASTKLIFLAGLPNEYEGCCIFQGLYWMGGTGQAMSAAAAVLHYWANPNTDADHNHQCYLDRQNQVVSYPPPPEPTY